VWYRITSLPFFARLEEVALMDEKRLWMSVFAIVIVIGPLVIMWNPEGPAAVIRDSYRLFSIFLGMLGGISLGEVFKIRNSQKNAKTLFLDLLEELRVNLDLLVTDLPLRKGFWILGIRSGRVQFIEQEKRRMLWEIYSRITHYNEDIGLLHRKLVIEGKGSLLPEIREEVEKFRTEIRERINQFLELYSG
jgi:hypothetical protein